MSYKIIGKYIKNIDFKIPNSKTFFLLAKDIENYKINIDIKSNQIQQKIVEILLSINLSPNRNNFETINTHITFATIIELERDNIEKNKLEKIILVDVPNQVYSELREIFVNLFKYSGFKDIKISKNIDFQKLYSTKKTQ